MTQDFDPTKKISQNVGFLERFENRVSGVFVGLAALGSIASISSLLSIVRLPAWIGAERLVILVLFMILGAVTYSFYSLWINVAESMDIADFIEPKRRTPVILAEKRLTVDVTEDGPDSLEYYFTLKGAFDDTMVNEFYFLSGTDKNMSWEDVDFDIDGGTELDHWRRDYRHLSRFLTLVRLNQAVGSSTREELSIRFDLDVVDPDENRAYLVVREPTDTAKIEIILPAGWVSAGRWCYERDTAGGQGGLCEPDPVEVVRDDGRRMISWETDELVEGESYIVEWKAEKPATGSPTAEVTEPTTAL